MAHWLAHGPRPRFCPHPLRTYNLGQNKWKSLTPPPPKSKMEKWRAFALRAASSLFGGGGGGGGLLFHFILSKIVGHDFRCRCGSMICILKFHGDFLLH